MNFGKFFSIFIFFSLVIFLIINWSAVSGIFNYKIIYEDIFNKKKEAVIKIPEIQLSEPAKEPEFIDKPDGLEISKISITAPLVFISTDETNAFEQALKNGVVHYYKSSLPDEKGNAVFLGHSAPSGWPKRDYEWIFSRLNELIPGDEIMLYYKNREYKYVVTNKYFLQPGDDVPSLELTNSEYVLSLISCWPPGHNIKRIVVQAERAAN